MTVEELIENLKELPQEGKVVLDHDCIRIVGDDGKEKGIVFVE